MNEHIFVVDDEQNFRFSAELALKKQGYKVSETADGGDALARILMAESNPPQFDLLLLDMELPTVSGLEIIRKLQEMKITIPAIIISGHLPSHIFKELLYIGCLDIFFKPINENVLINRVKDVFQTR
ncbi:MAG: response regulator [Desulfuromonadales bacterium]